MAEITTAPHPGAATAEDFLPINGTDYVEFYVGNAKQAAMYYAHVWLRDHGLPRSRRPAIAPRSATC